jgi:8-hydroxy-5-deazaflavin:NADPH oxidoreductase
MKIGVLGSGVVGQAIASALIEKGHSVMLGSRTARNEKTDLWVKENGARALQGRFADAAAYGELLFVALKGEHALDVIRGLDAAQTEGKTIVDITNPLDFSKGMPPQILEGLGNSTSLGEQVQALLPGSRVVKTLNTVNYKLMVNPVAVNGGDHNLFLCGDDADAKMQVKKLLADNFGWKPDLLIDLGSIQSARAIEAIVPFWVLIYRSLNSPLFNFKIVH